jgi:hypothetical protein
MNNNVIVYSCYHNLGHIDEYKLYENDWFKPYYTKSDLPGSINHLQEFFCEFVGMFYVLNNVDLSQYDYIGFEHYRRKGASDYVLLSEKIHNKWSNKKLKVRGDTPWSGKFDWFCTSRFENFVYDDLKTFISNNYSKQSRIYKIFITNAQTNIKWISNCVYITKVEYFKEIVECIYNFVLYINDKYNLQFDYDKYKKFIEDNWINTKLNFKNTDDSDFWLKHPEQNKYRIFAYIFEIMIGIYLGYIKNKI